MAKEALNHITVPDEAHGAAWDGSFQIPTKNAVFDALASKANVTEITALANSAANSSYPAGSYAFNALATDGYVGDGRLTGAKNGTLNAQRLQMWATGATYARYWIEGSTSWTAWSIYLDAQDFTAKGQTHFASASNVVGILAVGADGSQLLADSTATLGVAYGNGAATTLTDAATVAIDAKNAKTFYLSTALSRTIGIPTNLVAGKSYVLAIKNTSAGTITPVFTVAGTNAFRFGTDLTAVRAIAASKTAYYSFIFHPVDARTDIVAETTGF